jgi:hypothetical protein
MVTVEDAMAVLIEQCRGPYRITKHSTCTREFTSTYTSDTNKFTLDPELNNQVFPAYVPHPWINE